MNILLKSLKPPFLKKISMRDDKPVEWAKHPFNLPLFKDRDFEFVF
jgi:predicted ATPase